VTADDTAAYRDLRAQASALIGGLDAVAGLFFP
jgi:hypothetical protein